MKKKVPYPCDFSFGCVDIDKKENKTISEYLSLADKKMYHFKMQHYIDQRRPKYSNYIDKSGYAHYKFEQYRMSRTQDLESWYHDAGQFYVYNIDKFYKCNGDCKEIIPIVVSEMEVQDIDTEKDWELAEIKYMLMQRKTI